MSDNWVDMGDKLLTPKMKAELLSKINEINTEYKPDNEDLINYSSSTYNYATPIIFLLMIVLLGYWSFNNKAHN